MQERIKNCVLQIIAESTGTRGEGAYFIDVTVKGSEKSRKIEVLVDADDGIRIHQCAYISRRIRERIEGDDELLDLIGENFDLVVSSPGLGEAIMLPRQYIRHAGKLMSIVYRDESGHDVELIGHLQEVPNLEEERPRIVIMPEKNKKKGHQPKMESITLYLDQVIRAVPEAEL
ncbi:MAG: ribosome maturation factor RimP [Chlorobiales bacterium]|nr:ribosome maturation factor RimP [Chlorobiales bacterium]